MSRRAALFNPFRQEIQLLEQEARQLKETIAALRQALEQANADREAALARILAESNQGQEPGLQVGLWRLEEVVARCKVSPRLLRRKQ